MIIEIDSGSGFCFGVTTAINRAEAQLSEGGQLYCLECPNTIRTKIDFLIASGNVLSFAAKSIVFYI